MLVNQFVGYHHFGAKTVSPCNDGANELNAKYTVLLISLHFSAPAVSMQLFLVLLAQKRCNIFLVERVVYIGIRKIFHISDNT